jgi:hypothetical protein
MNIQDYIESIEQDLHWNAPNEPTNSATKKLLEIIKLQQGMIEELQQDAMLSKQVR